MIEVEIRKIALANAAKYGGKTNVKSVLSKLIFQHPELKGKIKEIIPIVEKIVKEVNEMGLEKQLEEIKKLGIEIEKKKEEKKELEELPNAEVGKVVTRYPPAMTGYPHFGHVYNCLINYFYSQKYKGKFVVRYEDTDPKLAKEEYYKEFDFFLEFLNVKYEKKTIISRDYMKDLYKYGKKLIEIGKAYVCLKPKEEIKRARELGIELEDRNRAPEDNLELFDKMLEGYFEEGKAVVLFKGDVRSQNTRLRDPAMFRIVKHPHPIVGDKYVVWPTYDFSNAVCDALDGVTHIIRSAEFAFAAELHNLIRKYLGFEEITTIETSRVGIKNNITSKRKIRKLIQEGKVMGWDDPRLVTLRGLIRRGIQKETLYEIVKELGLTTAQPVVDFSKIAAINRKILDKRTKRMFCVPEWIILEVQNIGPGAARVRNHPNVDLGYREIEFEREFYVPKEAESLKEFRLMHLFNVKIIRKENGRLIGEKTGEEIRKDLKKFQWVPKGFESWIELWMIGDLLKNGEFNENSLIRVNCPAERNIKDIKIGEIVQFERVGFCRKDSEKVFILGHR